MGIYVLAEDITLSRQIEITGSLDTHSIRDITLFARYIPLGGVVINAGAFIGDHAEVFSRLVGPDGHVFAFEPHPLAYDALRLNMARLTNVTVDHCALGNQAHPDVLHEGLDRGCSCLLPPGTTGISKQRDGTEAPMATFPIEVKTLDTCLLPSLTRCDLMHLDAEGHELQILLGAKALIETYRPALVLEMGACHLTRWGLSPEMLMDYLNKTGYQSHRLNDVGQGDGVFNVLALPRVR